MDQRELTALTYREIRSGQTYLLIRVTDSGELVVNVMQVVSKPTYSPVVNETVFYAKGLYVNLRSLTEVEGEAIELSLKDVGCPRRRSRSKIQCRTFPYSEVAHHMLVREIAKRPAFWIDCFKEELMTIHYEVNQEQPSFALPVDSTRSSTALAGWKVM